MKNNLNRPFLVVLMLITYQRAITHHFIMDEKTKLTASDLLTGWQKKTIETLLECPDVTAIRVKPNRIKAEYIINRYGTVENCKNKDQAYWAIFGVGWKARHDSCYNQFRA